MEYFCKKIVWTDRVNFPLIPFSVSSQIGASSARQKYAYFRFRRSPLVPRRVSHRVVFPPCALCRWDTLLQEQRRLAAKSTSLRAGRCQWRNVRGSCF